jgi:hypothetical protein
LESLADEALRVRRFLARLTDVLTARPDPPAWHDYTAFVGGHPPQR